MASEYTFSKKTAPNVSSGAGHYGNQPIDGARIAIQGIGNGPQTTDASASIISSPFLIPASGSCATLTTPESAVEITFVVPSLAQGIQVSEVNASFTSYVVIPSGVFPAIDIANTQSLWLRSPAAAATIAFYYNVV